MSRENVEVVRRAHSAANSAIESGELVSFLEEFYDPNARYEPVEESESLQGTDEIAEYFHRWLDVWDDFRWEMDEIIDAGDQVVSSAVLSGRADSSGVEISQRIFHVTELRDLKVVRVREFLDREPALEAAGLLDS